MTDSPVGDMPYRYVAHDGRVYARYSDKREIEVSTALTANGRDLEKFDAALDVARAQRKLKAQTPR